jgi:peptidoglycan hydrolase-like protein with peptidoglycan-binding domain
MTQTEPDTTFQAPQLPAEAGNSDGEAAPTPATGHRWPARKWWFAGGVAAVAIVGLVASGGGGDSTAQSGTSVGPINTAEVTVTDLVQEVTFAGTLGTVAGDPIVASTGGVVTDVAAAGSTVAEADVLYRIDNEPVVLLYGDTPAYRDLALGSDTMTIAASGSGVVTDVAAPGTIIEQGDIVYWVDGQPVVALYGTTPAYRTLRDLSTDMTGSDIAQLETALADLGYDLGGSLTIDDQFTSGTSLAVQDWQEDLGVDVDGIIEPGDVIFVPGPSQVVDLAVTTGQSLNSGAPVATLATGAPLSGADVEQLEAALADQGFDADSEMVVDGVFTAETAQAVADWQTAVGQTPDGVINLGDVVFLPGSIRVADQLAATGATVNIGAPVLAISSAEQVVRVDVPAAEQGLIEIGDPVTVILPGFEEAPGTIVSISTTATVRQDGETLFEAIVELDDAAAASGLDEAPVDVNVAGDTATGVTAVPVTALVALSGGGYAVEVQIASGGYQLVAVEPGFFADGLVAITSDSLSAGDTVTLP